MPAWLDTAIFYEIYPQSFQDSNADGIGDLPGIISRLDYIRELGCTAIWLNPCFDSPFADAGYDIRDYCRVASRYGTNEDIKALFDEVHQRGMRIILDLVPGHTSIEHPWFRESQKPEKNEYSHRYIWTDSIWTGTEDISSVSGWLRGISARNGSCAVNFFSTQPALNYGFAKPTKTWQFSYRSPEAIATREAMKDVMRFWLKMGCDGFRVDMAGSLVKNDPDGEATIELWQDFRKFLDTEFSDAAIISEWGEPDKSLRGGFHMDFLLHFGPSHYNDLFRCDEPYFSHRSKGDASAFIAYYTQVSASVGSEGFICIPSGNHDMPRLAKNLNDEELKLAFVFLLSMPGVPFIYYGDEIGMRYLDGLVSVEGGYNRTGARTPMQWNSHDNAGFSDASPDALYIMQDPDPERPTVEKSLARSDSLYNEIRKLIHIRHTYTPLRNNGTVTFFSGNAPHTYPLVYLRASSDKRILVAINPSARTTRCAIPEIAGGKLLYVCNKPASFSGNNLVIPPSSACFWEI